MTDEELTTFLHREIPITRAMGAAVETQPGGALVLTAPLEPNHNHLGTAFGGSLGALAVLAGYAFLWLRLENGDAHIVVRSSSLDYRRPVKSGIRATCRQPGAAEFAAFRETFERKGKARITLEVIIEENDAVCVTFRGVYVALK